MFDGLMRKKKKKNKSTKRLQDKRLKKAEL